MTGSVLIVGAGSAIARAIAHRFAQAGCDIILAARDSEDCAQTAADIATRHGVRANSLKFDALHPDSHAPLLESALQLANGNLAGIVVAHGLLPEQSKAQTDMRLLEDTIATNLLSPMVLLSVAANHFEQRQAGFICAITSVAGDRGRQSNYIYGASKGGLSVFLQGLRQRLAKSNVTVLTVKPGFIDTAMTWGLGGLFLVATPEKVARDVFKAVEKKRSVIYTPWFWWGIMTIIKSIPEMIFKRLKL